MDGIADRVPTLAAERGLQPSTPERHGLDRLVLRQRLAAEHLAQGFFIEAAERGLRSLGLLLRTEEQIVGKSYGFSS